MRTLPTRNTGERKSKAIGRIRWICSEGRVGGDRLLKAVIPIWFIVGKWSYFRIEAAFTVTGCCFENEWWILFWGLAQFLECVVLLFQINKSVQRNPYADMLIVSRTHCWEQLHPLTASPYPSQEHTQSNYKSTIALKLGPYKESTIYSLMSKFAAILLLLATAHAFKLTH